MSLSSRVLRILRGVGSSTSDGIRSISFLGRPEVSSSSITSVLRCCLCFTLRIPLRQSSPCLRAHDAFCRSEPFRNVWFASLGARIVRPESLLLFGSSPPGVSRSAAGGSTKGLNFGPYALFQRLVISGMINGGGRRGPCLSFGCGLKPLCSTFISFSGCSGGQG